MALIPISLFLTTSFFVLFALRKVSEKWLKVVGYLAVGSLLLAAFIVFSSAVLNMAGGRDRMKCNMVQKMKRCGLMQMLQGKDMPEMAMPEKGALPRE
jgi:hypothetical protein